MQAKLLHKKLKISLMLFPFLEDHHLDDPCPIVEDETDEHQDASIPFAAFLLFVVRQRVFV